MRILEHEICSLWTNKMIVAIVTKETYVSLICILFCVHNGESSQNLQPQYCPYFQNRAPSPQPSLDNCTWYKEKACCLNEELAIIFSNLLPMAGADAKCLKALNHLYCYVCSPEQSSFFTRDMLTVCEESCDVVHAMCANALLKGVPWRDLYSNGTEFCTARKFYVEKSATGRCFDFVKLFKSFAMSVRASWISLLCLAFLLVLCVF